MLLSGKELGLDNQADQVDPNTISLASIVLDAQEYGIYDSKIAEINFCLTEKFNKKKFEYWKTTVKDLLDDNVKANIKKLQTIALLTLFVNLKISEIKTGDAQTIFDICEYYLGTKDASEINLLNPVTPNQELAVRIGNVANHLACLITNLKEIALFFQAGWIRLLSLEEAEMNVELANSKGFEKPFIIYVPNTKPYQLALSYINPESGKIAHQLIEQDFITLIATENNATVSRLSDKHTFFYRYQFTSHAFGLLVERAFIDNSHHYDFNILTTQSLSYLISCELPDVPMKTPADGCEISLQEITSEGYKAKTQDNYSAAYLPSSASNVTTQALSTSPVIETPKSLEENMYSASPTQATSSPVANTQAHVPPPTPIVFTSGANDNNLPTTSTPPQYYKPLTTNLPPAAWLDTTQSSFFTPQQKSYLQTSSNVTSQQKEKALQDLGADLNTMSQVKDIHKIFKAISADNNILRQHRKNVIFPSGNTASYIKAIKLIFKRLDNIQIFFADYQILHDILKTAIQCKVIENVDMAGYKIGALNRLTYELSTKQNLSEIYELFTQVINPQHFLRYERLNYIFNYGDTDSYAAAIFAIARKVCSVTINNTITEKKQFEDIIARYKKCFIQHYSTENKWIEVQNDLVAKYNSSFYQSKSHQLNI